MRLRTALVLAILFFFAGGAVDVYGGPPRKPPSQRPAVKKPLKKPAAKPVTKPTAKPAAKKPTVSQANAAQKQIPKKSAGSQKPGAKSANKTASGTAAGQRRTVSGVRSSGSASVSGPEALNRLPRAVSKKGVEFFRMWANRRPFNSSVRQFGDFTEFAVSIPGDSKGSYTRWVKIVGKDGRTTKLYHDTYVHGQFRSRGIKVPGPDRHVYRNPR